jgi:hypothetical protein
MKTTKREIAKLAFLKLLNEGKYQEACRIADRLFFGDCIALNTERDEVGKSIRYCAGDAEGLFSETFAYDSAFSEPFACLSVFIFEEEIEISEEQDEKNKVEFPQYYR